MHVNIQLSLRKTAQALYCLLYTSDSDSVKVIQSLSRFTEGKLEGHMHGEAQGHDMSVMFVKLQGVGILRQGV